MTIVRNFLAATLLVASLAHAQIPLLVTDVWTEVGPEKVRPILQSMGFDFTEKAGEKSVTFYFQLSGYKVTLESHAAYMEMAVGFNDKIDLSVPNEWNRTHLFTRAYIDTDQGAMLESDLDFAGGVTKNTIEEFIKTFRGAVAAFAKIVANAPAANSTTTPARTNTPPPPPAPTVSGPGILVVNDGKMSVRYDSTKWTQTPTKDPGRFEFTHTRGDGYALVIAERLNVPTDSIVDIALQNIRKEDPNAKVTVKQKRRVGGVDLWYQRVDATVSGIPITYMGYYYGGNAGAIQVLTYTGANLAQDYEQDFINFLNGFSVR